jgi:hemolysin activation/secretion protein
LLWGGVGLLASPASAQEAEGTRRRPLERQPTLPAEPVPDEPARLELPPIPRSARPDALSSGLRTYVREYRFEGNRAIEDAELAAVAAPWTGRAITSEELLALRDALTRHYVERGYVTSGALIPDQSVEDGVIELRIVEGRLTDIEIQGQRWFRETTLRNRLAAGTSDPVNVAELQEQLQLLQRDVRIRATHARLVPGEQLGESRLVVRIEEEHPFFLSLGAANDRSPSIGDEFGRLRTGHRNLLGLGDAFSVAFNGSEGLSDWEGRYALPVSPHGTLLELFAEGSHSEVVNGPFRDAEIESEYSAYGASLRHPLLRTTRDELVIGLTGERRRSSTEIFGRETSFGPGSEDGVSKVFALRAFQEWTRQTRDQVIAVRSIVSFGLDAFDATTHSDSSVPDGRYVAWLAQGQWARRLDWPARETLAIARADLQLSDDPLLSLEQFSIGGLRTVRGFPENQVVRDNGFVASIEVRIPIWRNVRRGAVLELAPFVDYGWVWDRRRHRRVFRFDQDPPTEVLASAGRDSAVLASAGLGLRYRVAGRLSAYVYWGGRLKKVERIDSSDLQNHGFHVGVSFELY